jgi:hypothetical protein
MRMANQEHLDLLKRGAEVWNQWRKQHPRIHPDLSLPYIDKSLTGASLFRADLRGADLTETSLFRVDLSEANLQEANLTGTDLRLATLRKANLREASLRATILSGADLSGANLREANLREATLNEANLTEANVGWTLFGNVDLSVVKGLETVRHEGPSIIGIDTIYGSKGNIPEAFLKGVGVDDTFIAYIHALVGKAIEYYSCFISYSSKDEDFARRLYADLQSHNVRCWFAPEDMKTGDEIRSRIDEAIRIHDKLLLVLSEHSVNSPWVKKEVETAFEKEQQQKRLVFFPIRLDDTVMQTTKAWAADIRRTRHITDFTSWKDHDAYQRAFNRLLRDLKAATYR